MRFQSPLAVVVVALAACGRVVALLGQPYKLEASSIVAVPESERISATHLFQREISIVASSSRAALPFITVTSDVRGRLFVSYDDKPPADERIFGKITIAGSSESAVGLVEFPQDVNDYTYPLTLQPPLSVEVKDTELMLIDVKLYKPNSLKNFNMGSGEGIVTEKVLYAPTDDYMNATVFGWGSGSIFVSDPSAKLSAMDLYAYSPNGTFQAEVGQINGTDYRARVTLPRGGNATLIADQINELRVSYADEAGRDNMKLCISSKTTPVNVTSDFGEYYGVSSGKETSKIVPSGVVCTKLPVPERATTQIGKSGNGKSTQEAAKGTASSGGVVASVSGVATMLVAAVVYMM